MIVLGLTGSIGMGKSTTTAMFAEEGALVWNADEVVHRLYAKDGAVVAPIAEAFPGVVIDGAVDRTRLAEALGRDDQAFRRLEAIVHPLVLAHRLEDLAAAQARGVKLAVLDIPLLFETRGQGRCDLVVVVTAPAAIQRWRVLRRPGMTPERLTAILARQLPDAEKRRRADRLVHSGLSRHHAQRAIRAIVREIRSPTGPARGTP